MSRPAAFTAFAPRSVASAAPVRTNSPGQYSAAPVTTYNSTAQYPPAPPDPYAAQPPYESSSYTAIPQIRNPFVPTPDPSGSASTYGGPPNYDPDYEAQIQQWQSAYVSKDGGGDKPSVSTRPGTTSTSSGTISRNETSTQDHAPKTVQRQGGGSSWNDSTLLEWDPAHFRIFVGNLAGEVTDESLLKAFSKYPSVQKARVIRDKRTTKSKGYGFVSFSDGDDYFQAAREMNGKYIGSHPVLIKRSTTEVRPSTVQHKGKNKGKGGGGGGKVDHGGIQKKPPKTKGGLKVLG